MITASIEPDNADDKDIVWTSSDETIASVSDGVVVGIKAGQATITASCDGVSEECVVTVLTEADLNLEDNVKIQV